MKAMWVKPAGTDWRYSMKKITEVPIPNGFVDETTVLRALEEFHEDGARVCSVNVAIADETSFMGGVIHITYCRDVV